jgi:orotidine-5'-phosphate decarboxylase
MPSFSDRLGDAVRHKGNPLCVGIDPRWDSIPAALRQKYDDGTRVGMARAYTEFGLRVLDLVAVHVPVVKIQSAFFEACGPEGFVAQEGILRRARELDLVTILDAKRGDIASTATAYAEAAFEVWDADALTVSPYLGRDAVEPFITMARNLERGLFVLVRTSNPGSGLFQNLDCGDRLLYQQVAAVVGEWNREHLGDCGLGDVGAVIGATQPTELKQLRSMIPHVWFLVPGFGAQGGTADDVAGAFRADGLGAIVNSSRGIIFPFDPHDVNWEDAIVKATEETARALRKCMGK